MALRVRNTLESVMYAMVSSYNAMRLALATAGTQFHLDVTSNETTGDFTTPTASAMTIVSPNASSLATSAALANELKAKFNIHAADVYAHKAADTTNGPVVTADADPLTLSTVEALANALKTAMNAHLTQSGVHVSNDSTNTLSSATATDQTTSNTLLNEIKTKLVAHMASAPAGQSIALIAA